MVTCISCIELHFSLKFPFTSMKVKFGSSWSCSKGTKRSMTGWGSSCVVFCIFWHACIGIWLLGFSLKIRNMTMLLLMPSEYCGLVWKVECGRLQPSCSFPFYSGRCEDHIHQTPVHSFWIVRLKSSPKMLRTSGHPASISPICCGWFHTTWTPILWDRWCPV